MIGLTVDVAGAGKIRTQKPMRIMDVWNSHRDCGLGAICWLGWLLTSDDASTAMAYTVFHRPLCLRSRRPTVVNVPNSTGPIDGKCDVPLTKLLSVLALRTPSLRRVMWCIIEACRLTPGGYECASMQRYETVGVVDLHWLRHG